MAARRLLILACAAGLRGRVLDLPACHLTTLAAAIAIQPPLDVARATRALRRRDAIRRHNQQES